MKKEVSRILVIANPFAPSGVRKHVINVLRFLSRKGIEIYLHIPIITLQQFSKHNMVSSLKELEKDVKLNFTQDIYDLIEVYQASISQLKYFVKSHFYNPSIDLKYFKMENIAGSKIDLIYDMHENVDYLKVSYLLAKVLNTFVVKLFHDEPFRFSLGRGYRRFMGIKGLAYDLSSWFFYHIDRTSYKEALNYGILRGIAAVSEAPIYLSRFRDFAKDHKVKIEVLKPGNAFDSEIKKFYSHKKEDYAVYFARLVPQKGIREIPKVGMMLKDYKILVYGRFFEENEKERFLRSSPNNVVYKGFVSEQELYSAVSKAKVLLYPSHQDGFSLVILESLALGTPVVAYDIPATRYVYSNLPPVRLVKEFDIVSLSKNALKFLKMSSEEIHELFNETRTKEFLEFHSSWEKVGEATLNFLNSLLNKN